MRAPLDPFSFVLTSIAGWMNQHQQHVIEYLMEENRVLREQMGSRRQGNGILSHSLKRKSEANSKVMFEKLVYRSMQGTRD